MGNNYQNKDCKNNGDSITIMYVLIRTLCRFVLFEQFSILFGKKVIWHDSASDTKLASLNQYITSRNA